MKVYDLMAILANAPAGAEVACIDRKNISYGDSGPDIIFNVDVPEGAESPLILIYEKDEHNKQEG